jgi:hypothetical protein
MPPYQQSDPEMTKRFELLDSKLKECPDSQSYKTEANLLALKIRGRCMDLAAWKADMSPEYELRLEQCKILTKYAGEYAHDVLIREFRTA